MAVTASHGEILLSEKRLGQMPEDEHSGDSWNGENVELAQVWERSNNPGVFETHAKPPRNR